MNFVKLTCACLAIAFLVACGGKNANKELEYKKKKLSEYKSDLKELNKKIEALEKEIAKMDTSAKVEVKAKLVQTAAVKREDFNHYIEVQGTVDAEENVMALPQQPGIVKEVYVKVGDQVTKGQILGLTETTAAMETGIQALETQLSLATTAYEKQKALFDQKIGTEIQYLQAKAQKEALEKQIAGQRLQIDMSKIIAPISGTVDEVRLRVGDMAAPSQLMPGIRIINNGSLKVKAKLADSDFGKIKQGDVVRVIFPDINDSTTLPVSYVSRTIDTRSRTFGTEIKLPNGTTKYAANMIAKLKINDAIYKNVLLVPTNVIQKSTDELYVLTAEKVKDGLVVRKHMVNVGPDYGGQTIINGGLQEGDLIITTGYSELVDGQRIEF